MVSTLFGSPIDTVTVTKEQECQKIVILYVSIDRKLHAEKLF